MKRIWILLLIVVLLFIGVVSLFIVKARMGQESLYIVKSNSYLQSGDIYDAINKKIDYPNGFFMSITRGENDEFVYSYLGVYGDTISLKLKDANSTYEQMLYAHQRDYDYAYKNNAIDIDKWLEVYIEALRGEGISYMPTAIQIVDSIGNVLLSSNNFDYIPNKNKLIKTDGVRYGYEYNHMVVLFFPKLPFYHGIEGPLFISAIIFICFVVIVCMLYLNTKTQIQYIKFSNQKISHIRHELSKPLAIIDQGLKSVEGNSYVLSEIKAYIHRMHALSIMLLGDFAHKKIVIAELDSTIFEILNDIKLVYETINPNLSIIIHIDSGLEEIMVDSIYFPIILNNLIESIYENSSDERAKIILLVKTNGNDIVIYVKRNGIKINKLIDVKQKIDIAQRIAHTYRGNVQLKNSIEEGSYFTVRIKNYK